MEIEIGGLEVLLKEIPYQKITLWNTPDKECHTYNNWPERIFKSYAGQRFRYYNENETCNILEYLKNKSKDEKAKTEKGIVKYDIFQLISIIANDVLTYSDGNIIYKFDETLRWRNLSLYVGGDIFIAAYLADYYRDKDYRLSILCNGWKPSISTYVNSFKFKNGLAENHFHLQGSSKSFELNWISLMNYVLNRESEFKKIPYLLKQWTNDAINEVKLNSFAHTVYCAALYRVFLFLRINNDSLADKCRDLIERVEKINSIALELVKLDDIITTVRAYYHPDKIGKLDYAIPRDMSKFQRDSKAESWKVLNGERLFLTDCMCKIRYAEEGAFNEYEKNIFYRYLVMKNCFRNEIIQVNRMVGFQNFSNYQNRKRIFIKKYKIYEEELVRLALNATVDSQDICSLEARLCPENGYSKMCKRIEWYNDIFYEGKCAGGEQEELYYVLHIPKEISVEITTGEPRHSKFRNNIKAKCIAIEKMLKTYSVMTYYVRGIDACANEIGCRPEIFGMYFRKLLNTSFTGMKINWKEYKEGKVFLEEKDSLYLYATYHAGEDFLDIVDGLRAIDEAVLFCNLKKGCRIGHALALGVNPKTYYQFKHNELTMPKQDLLDNLVWLFCKAKCYRIDTISEMSIVLEMIEKEAKTLLGEIYSKDGDTDIVRYYFAWKLRGDSPWLYYDNECLAINKYLPNEYEINYEVDKEVCGTSIVNHVREEKDIVDFYHRYHFDEKSRRNGAVITKYKVPNGYSGLVNLVQSEMMKELVTKGISIECNPSSNYLIGTFERYDEHPIIRFNAEKIQPSPHHEGLQVSINTDDQGVFDTSLENEYYLMLSALKKAEDEYGRKKYNNCEEWLLNVAEMGNRQAFKFEGMHR